MLNQQFFGCFRQRTMEQTKLGHGLRRIFGSAFNIVYSKIGLSIQFSNNPIQMSSSRTKLYMFVFCAPTHGFSETMNSHRMSLLLIKVETMVRKRCPFEIQYQSLSLSQPSGRIWIFSCLLQSAIESAKLGTASHVRHCCADHRVL